MAVDDFNSRPSAELRAGLLACCAAPAWADAVLAGRPYASKDAVRNAGQAASEALSWDDVQAGLSAHPRIGERAKGDSREAEWSRREQSTADAAGDDETAAVNQAYEEKFGFVFLIFASEKSRAEIVAAARERLGNDLTREQDIVKTELGKIAGLRLERLLDD